ncbi:MAG TPA: type II toxin-antitoxin system VapB family antitoxin [Streptosporangiaceae bacterium]|jgi:antitoxin VapB
MALNIKDPETERLASQAAALTGDTKTGAIRQALREMIERRAADLEADRREARLRRLLEEEIWPLLPQDQLGKPLSKAEQEELLGIGPDGV